MFLFRRSGAGSSARLRALRTLYWSFTDQSTPEARARRLLREWLSPESYFEVTGSHTGRRYRIYYGTVSNFVQIDEAGQPETRWCFVPERALAAGDVMLAQKIALETDEMSVLARANRISLNLPRLHRVVRRAY
ncbi:hypothetical protein [Bradyrhizobium sp. LMG 9283]|uniref:hypothetical protein n=1 Tax=Bradyrhizobium sp. LMG 9283 TaxID=592064 RepID=UPI003890FB40